MASEVETHTMNAPANPASAALRLAWVDNLRTVMIVLVVNMHACVTYGHVGSWYRLEGSEPAMSVKIPFILWQTHLQAFFMGLLFFVAGAFAHHSLARRSTSSFLRERGRRLGLPSLLYMLAIHPFMVYVLLGHSHGPERPSLGVLYWDYLVSGRVLSGNGPMWFTLALLIFCVVLGAGRGLRPSRPGITVAGSQAPGWRAILGLVVALVAGTFLVRLVQPIGTSVLNFQLCFFPQYLAAFALGVVAGKHGWLEALATSRCARVAGWCGAIGGPLALATLVVLSGPPPETGPNPFTGGWNARAFLAAAWEQSTGVALALGCLAWFHRRWNGTGRFAAWLAERSFAVYLFHAPVLVALTPVIRPAAFHPFAGAALLTLVGLVLSFLVADVARRLPGVRSIL